MDIPTGVVVAYASESGPPNGWAFCYGQPVSSTDDQYKNLFAVIGTAHGGDGSPNFNLPDYRGYFLRGVDHGVGRDPDAGNRTAMSPGGGNSGATIGSVQSSAFQNHAHQTNGVFLQADGGTGFTGAGFEGNSGTFPGGQQNKQYGTSPAINGNPSSETRPVNAYVNYIIKL